MSRLRPLTDLDRSVWRLTALATRDQPMPLCTLFTAARHLAPPDQIHDALEACLDAGLLSTMTHTRDGVTQAVYWQTGIKPFTPPTDEERRIMSIPKNAWLLQAIRAHKKPISTVELSTQATAAGLNIPARNIPSLLETYEKKGAVIKSKINRVVHYGTPQPATANEEADDDAMPPADPFILAMANRAISERLEQIATAIGHEEGNDGKLVSSVIALSLERDELARKFADAIKGREIDGDNLRAAEIALNIIHSALNVATAEDAVAEIEHLQKLANARTDQDLGDLGRYRELLDQIASSLHCESLDVLPEVVANLGTAPMQAGRLAFLSYVDSEGIVMEYLEPYVGEEEARRLLIRRVETGELGHGVLVRAIYQARRQIEYGPVQAPDVSTLRG